MITRPSDTSINKANYSGGVGYYTDMTRITDLLGIAPFSDDTIPTLAHIGELIRYAEDYIDEYTRESWRPMIIEDEWHDFDFDWHRMSRYSRDYRYTDYVGFIRLHYENVRKIIRLAAWKGDTYNELAGATSVITISDYTNITSLVIQLPNGDNQNNSRKQGWWDIKSDGTIFFRTEYPYQVKHSMKITYMTGGQRVPAVITEAATKLVCCELMSSDDNTILLGENNQSGLDIKTKFDTYRADVEKILKMKKRLIYLVDSD
jgi:hypothetical protein